MSKLNAPRLAMVAWCATVGLLLGSAALSLTRPDHHASEVLDAVAFGTLIVGMATLGVLITRREPRNAIGWIFCVTPFLVALGVGGGTSAVWAAASHPHHPGVALTGWFSLWAWVCGLVAFAMLVPLLFPDGRPLSQGWRLVVRADLATLAVLAVVLSVQPQTVAGDVQNPVAIGGAANGVVLGVVVVAAVVLIVAGLVSAVIRYRRAGHTTRLQMRECVLAAMVTFVGVFVISAFAAFEILYILDYSLVPLAVGLAMLRYRLYDVDVIIRRTLTYTCLVSALAGIYLAGVAVIGMLLQSVTGASSTLAVTLSTLVAAAAFQPLRGRIQRVVNRRFFRAGYDAQTTVAAFGIHLREQIDLDSLSEELVTVVTRAVQPTHASLWLRPAERNPGRSA